MIEIILIISDPNFLKYITPLRSDPFNVKYSLKYFKTIILNFLKIN